MNRTFAYSIAAAAALVTSAPAFAGAVVSGFTASGTIPQCDDSCTQGPLALGFTANYFGTNYTTTYLSNNGYVTFGGGQTAFTPVGLGSGYTGLPIIAAFFADVDTRAANGGSVQWGSNTFGGRNAFGATWTDVGYYPSQSNKLNTFQLLLVDRSDIAVGDFDIVLNYDKIQWETGGADGGTNGVGGTSASVGYNKGTGATAGQYGTLPGSLVNGALLDNGPNSLVAGSNVGVAGRYIFNVRSGAVTPPPTNGAVPEPATWAMMIGGFGMIGASLRYRRRKTIVSFA